MSLKFLVCICILQLVGIRLAEGFSPLVSGSRVHASPLLNRAARFLSSVTDPHQVEDFEDWSEERKSSLFQFLLRDLEVEGVPLLGCDGVAANKTLQGATWTVAGQLSENEFERKVCLVLEDIPVRDLKTFVTGFSDMKKDEVMMKTLPDLRRFSLNLVGNGIGPALVLETQNRTNSENAEYASMLENTPTPDEARWKAAMESFVKRCFPELEADPIVFRFVGSPDICDILSGYWNCICELEATDESQANAIALSFPPSSEAETHTRFVAISALLNAMNSLYKSDYRYDLFHYHPQYNRENIQPQDRTLDGHIPSNVVVRNILEENGEFSDDELNLRNYKRRSPLPGVIIKRITSDPKEEITQEILSTITDLVEEGEEKLEDAVLEDAKLLGETN